MAMNVINSLQESRHGSVPVLFCLNQEKQRRRGRSLNSRVSASIKKHSPGTTHRVCAPELWRIDPDEVEVLTNLAFGSHFDGSCLCPTEHKCSKHHWRAATGSYFPAAGQCE